MAYRQNVHYIQEFVPTYQVKSDYLPNRVVDGQRDNQASLVLRQYEEQKRRGHVYTNRPVEFNPARYRSVRVFENVLVDQPISEQTFSRMVRKY